MPDGPDAEAIRELVRGRQSKPEVAFQHRHLERKTTPKSPGRQNSEEAYKPHIPC